jgi:hypothetical protein
MVVNLAFYSCNLPRPPRQVPVQRTGEHFPPLRAPRQFHCHTSQNVRGPRRASQNGGWKCSSFGTVAPTGTLFWQPEELSEPPDYQNSAQTKRTAIYIPNVHVCLIIDLRRVVDCENEVGRSKPFCSDVLSNQKLIFCYNIYLCVFYLFPPAQYFICIV